ADFRAPDGTRCFHAAVVPASERQISIFLIDITARKHAETILQASEARLRTVLENMPVLLCAAAKEGRIVTWNRECERVTGYTEAEVLSDPDVLKKLIPDLESREKLLAGIFNRSEERRVGRGVGS